MQEKHATSLLFGALNSVPNFLNNTQILATGLLTLPIKALKRDYIRLAYSINKGMFEFVNPKHKTDSN